MIRAERDLPPPVRMADDRTTYDDPPRPTRWGRLFLLFVLAVTLVAGGAWGWLVHGKRVTAMFASGAGDGVPMVRADPAPFKTRPRDPGGMEVPDRDKLVYERLEGEKGEVRVERLLPPAEKPIVPPRATPDQVPAPAVTERLPRVPTEVQVLAAKPPAPPAILRVHERSIERTKEPREQLRVPEPEDAPPTAEETAPVAEAEGKNESVAATSESSRPTERTPAPPPAPPAPAAPAPVAPQPSVSRPAAATPPPVAAMPAAETAQGFLIQIAAVREPERAESEWERLQRQHPEPLRGLKLFVIKADLGDKGVFWRLRAGPFADEDQAKSRCADLARRKVGCLVVKAQG